MKERKEGGQEGRRKEGKRQAEQTGPRGRGHGWVGGWRKKHRFLGF